MIYDSYQGNSGGYDGKPVVMRKGGRVKIEAADGMGTISVGDAARVAQLYPRDEFDLEEQLRDEPEWSPTSSGLVENRTAARDHCSSCVIGGASYSQSWPLGMKQPTAYVSHQPSWTLLGCLGNISARVFGRRLDTSSVPQQVAVMPGVLAVRVCFVTVLAGLVAVLVRYFVVLRGVEVSYFPAL
jgi:hypothetical protein